MKTTRPPARESFFRTKLLVPGVVPGTVPRPRLHAALSAGADGPLTLVSAPAGSGKTALLASWIADRGAPGSVAWLSLDRDDNDRRLFWTEVVAALAGSAPSLRSLALPPRARIDAFLPALVATVAALTRPVTLVLDDFHEVTDTTVSADLERLLEHAPRSLRLVVSTRQDPPFRLQRLRLDGRLTEVRAQELAFTLEEAQEFARSRGLPLGHDDVEALWARTEGWAAGLRFAAFSLEGHDDPHAFVETFAGDDHAVSDYLLSEVIAREAPEVRDFLLRTSVVERLSGDLADVLTGGSESDRTLAELGRRGGLVVALDDHGTWYRYHPLFAEVLRMELARTLRDQVPELHRRAGRWHAEHGHPVEAVRHAVAARDWELVADVLAEHWLPLVIRGGAAILRELIASVPEEVVRANAELALATGGILLDCGEDARADELLSLASELAPGLPERRRRRHAIVATTTELYRARLRGDVEEAVRAAATVLGEHWEQAVAEDVRALTLVNLGVAEFWADRAPAAGRHIQEAIGVARECGNEYVLFVAQTYAAAVDLQVGRMDEAWRRARAAATLAELRGWAATPPAAIAYAVMGAIRIYWNELEAAATLVEQARLATRHSGERLAHIAIAQVEARLLVARGEPLTALDALRAATSAAGAPVPRFLRVSSGMFEAELLLDLGQLTEARQVLRVLAEEGDAPDPAVGLAQLELAAGDPQAALRALAVFARDGREAVRPYAHVEASVIEAIARDELRDEPGALQAMERALDLAEPRGLRNPIIRYGAPVRSLVRRRIAAGTAHRSFAADLLSELEDPAQPSRPMNGVLLDPLSDRELVVLRFLPTMMSNAEIAAEMFVSVNTVKTHLKHVYRKLDVADRRDAVQRARELHLLGPGLSARAAPPSAHGAAPRPRAARS